MIHCYTQPDRSHAWITQFQGQRPRMVCVLGFTETGLISGISAAGATPRDREFTALADAEFLWNGVTDKAQYPLPPLTAGASPVFITRAVVEAQELPTILVSAGLRHPLTVPAIDLEGQPAQCVQTGQALPLDIVQHLFERGLQLGTLQAAQVAESYLILSECVVGGTTTALAALMGLGWAVAGKVNSSHPACNHHQKLGIVQRGLQAWAARPDFAHQDDPFQVIAAVGDPMQIVVAGMAIAASRSVGVLLAGGTQMLAVYALIRAIATYHQLDWHPKQVVVGTTRWVAEDPTGDTVGLAKLLDAPLIASQLSFATSRFPQLQAYEQGFVKEGVGAGGCAIAAHLYQNWTQAQLLNAIEALLDRYARQTSRPFTSPSYTASES